MPPRKRQAHADVSSESSSSKVTNKKKNLKDKVKNEEYPEEKIVNEPEAKPTKSTDKDIKVSKTLEKNQSGGNKATKSQKIAKKNNKEDNTEKSEKISKNSPKEKISGRGKKRKIVDDDNSDVDEVEEPAESKSRKVSKKKIKKEESEETEQESDYPKTEQITREMIQNYRKWVGAHVSIAGGLYKAVEEACSLESNAFGLFLRSQRRWESPPLAQKSIDEFEKTIKEKKFGCSSTENKSPSYFDSIKNQILPHGSYLINLGNPDKAKREKSYTVFLDDLKRCDSLSIALYNLHPGSTCGQTTIENSISLIAENINKAHKETQNVKIVIENMAGQGNIVGSKFKELSGIIKLVENKNRIGVCLDTCHLFAAGYDVRTSEAWNKTLNDFDKTVGLKYLSAMHLNDSKGPLGSNKDRHEQIGKGYIGLDCFKFIMEDERFCNMPLILETPDEKFYFKEIQLLHSFLKPKIKKEDKN